MISRFGSLTGIVLLLGGGCGAMHGEKGARPKHDDGKVHARVTTHARTSPTQAQMMLMSEFSLAPYMGYPYKQRRAFPLAAGEAGFLDETDARAIATLAKVERFAGPKKLVELCVAKNGKTTFAFTHDEGEVARLWMSDSFRGPMRPIGFFRAEGHLRGWITTAPTPPKEPYRWFVSSDTQTSFVDCDSGVVDPVGPPVSFVSVEHWTDARQLVTLHTENPDSSRCLSRTAQSKNWTTIPLCRTRSRRDHSLVVETSPFTSDGPFRCIFILDSRGNQLGCDAPEGPRMASTPPDHRPTPDIELARLYARSRIVRPGHEGMLERYGGDGKPIPNTALVTRSFRDCTPLLPIAPLFLCKSGKLDVVVRVDPDGEFRIELERPNTTDEYRIYANWRSIVTDRIYQSTNDGVVATYGRCNGHLKDAVCVRGTNGVWRDVLVSKQLRAAANANTRYVQLLPKPNGETWVAVSRSNALFYGGGALQLFRDTGGGAIEIPKTIRPWSRRTLSIPMHYGLLGWDAMESPSVGWSADGRIRVWPLAGEEPAPSTKQLVCHVEFGLDGSADHGCMVGRLIGVGRFGILEKYPGELYETLDAGESWTRVALPAGTDTDDTECYAIGCRIGPYWRMGWGEPTL